MCLYTSNHRPHKVVKFRASGESWIEKAPYNPPAAIKEPLEPEMEPPAVVVAAEEAKEQAKPPASEAEVEAEVRL